MNGTELTEGDFVNVGELGGPYRLHRAEVIETGWMDSPLVLLRRVDSVKGQFPAMFHDNSDPTSQYREAGHFTAHPDHCHPGEPEPVSYPEAGRNRGGSNITFKVRENAKDGHGTHIAFLGDYPVAVVRGTSARPLDHEDRDMPWEPGADRTDAVIKLLRRQRTGKGY